ncbi:MAG: DUF2442 domain-containing protein [Lentisphaerae bacterium]|nr:DUF2442 domain-containing protein [Lentisphaerota bacterium]
MDKAHDVRNVSVSGSLLHLDVDGRPYEIDLTEQSRRLARATQCQRERLEVSPSGYGLHWPDIDEDLSIDGLIGVEHSNPVLATHA